MTVGHSAAATTPTEAPTEVVIGGADAPDVALAGLLRLPDDVSAPVPGLVFTGPFTGVKEQVVGTYAAALARAGFATLAFDHRGFGASSGPVRQHEDSAAKLADLGLATSFLARHEAVDAGRLGCVGICLGGGYALRYAAFDPRIRAVALVAGGYNDPRAMRDGMGPEAYRAAMAAFADVEQRQHETGTVEYLPAVADAPGVEAAMGGAEPFAYYGTSRAAGPGWVNRVSRLSIRTLLAFDAAVGADFLGPTPALVVHGRRDDYCPPAAAREIFDRLTGPKDLLWLDTTNHIDLYDQPAHVAPAVERIARWMHTHL
jgi:hypothetical protein